MLRLPTRPWPLALLVGLGAECLFAARLGTPAVFVFDEVHYIPAARALLAGMPGVNPEHPLLGKALIAAGIAVLGDGPVGWRAAATLAGTGVVVGVFALLWQLYREPRTALLGAALAALNFTVFVQARVAMLDGFMAALVVGALAAAAWALRAGAPGPAARRWALAATLLGLATGAKWTAAPYLAFAAAGFALARWRAPWRWGGLGVAPAWAILAGVGGGTYVLTFLPALLRAREPLTLAGLPAFHRQMWALQTQVLPHHAYQSAWWGWPVMARPIWYLYEPVGGVLRGVVLLGNPAVLWGGLVAVAACLWAGWRGERRAGALALLWLASWLMWAAVPKSLGFFYYYYLSSIWLAPVIAAAFHAARPRLRGWDEAFLAAAAGPFIHFYPVLAARPLAGPGTFLRWMWFRSWI